MTQSVRIQPVLNSVTLNEAKTRAFQIDPRLRAADWKLNDRTQVRLEVPVDGYDAEPWNGVTDYCLYDPSGNVLAVVEAKRALPVSNALPINDPSTGCRRSSLANPLLSGKSITRWRNWRRSASGNHTPTTSQRITCLMLVEIARMRSRGSKFEIKVFVMSSSNFRRSLSRCVSGLALGDSWELNDWFDNEECILTSPCVKCRTNSHGNSEFVSAS